MDISILIVNYNTAELVERCVESVLKQKNVNFEIIVVDNASADNSVLTLQKFGDKINLIANQENLGFGKANNRAFADSCGRYAFLLNPDAELLGTHDLAHIVKFMDTHKEYGLVGTRIIDLNSKLETPPKYSYPGEKYTNYPFKDLPGKIAFIIGASMVFRREVFNKIHGFDENFFLYAEDADICLRTRKAGFKIGYLDGVSIQHVDAASERKISSYNLTIKKARADQLFFKKHYNPGQVAIINRHILKQARVRKLLHCLRLMFHINPDRGRFDHYRALVDLINSK